jgi:Zn-dependent M16 (insulinase) family peptidase
MNRLSKLENLTAYTVVEKKELKEVNGYGYILSHNKTKARVAVIENDDTNKVFTIGFRTPPADDTGVPHITEHSVLCGSRKFPVKDPFVELCKGSLNTFLNAMTYSDKTVYPLASLNEKDFHNLMHVYMDAVFYPNMYEKKEIMMQEGWHYEIDEETGELTYNGVVFNEMKGVYSSSEQQLYRIIEKSLLPHTAYGFESGGDPEAIPNLTQEDFIAFHKRYYHPSNSYIYLYGDMDAEAELRFIDEEYLQNFDYLEIDSALTDEPAFEKPVEVREYYSIAENESEQDNTYLTYNTVVGTSADKKLCTAFSILEYALLLAPGAPLKKALIDAGLGKDILSSFDDGIKQPNFSIIAKNANAEDLERFIQVLEDTLASIVEQGMDKKSLLAAINYFEFKHKEGNFGRFPKGLMLGLNAFSTWLYDDAAALDLFSLNDVYDALKQDVETGYFEALIKQYILQNTHKSYCLLMPKKGLNNEIAEREKARLAAYKETLSAADIEEIRANMMHLKEYQSSGDAEEDLKKIPMLAINDIEKHAKKINNRILEIEHVKVLSHDIFTNGITYLSLNFCMDDIDYDKFPVIALLTEIFKYVDTEHFSYSELSNEINLYTGGIGFSTTVTNKKEYGGYVTHFVVSAKMLDAQLDKAMELIEEILFTSKLSDKKRLKEIIAETRAAMKDDLLANGHTTAAGRATAYISKIGVVKELTEGVDYYMYLSDLDDHFEERYEGLAADLQETLGQLLRRDSLLVNFTSDKKPEDTLTESLTGFSCKLSTRLAFENVKEIPVVKKNEGFKTASQVQYVATAGNFCERGYKYTGALNVLQCIFSYDYLWINVRVKGGAYGCMCSFNRSGNAYFTSYRDPNLLETYEIYKEAPDYVRSFEADERDMTKYIIGAISRMDAPLTPSADGNFSLICYLMGIDDADLQRTRDEVLGATPEVIRGLAGYVEAAVDGGVICAIGDEARIEDAKDAFTEVKSVF